MSLLPAVACFIVGILLLVFVGSDLSRLTGAVAYGLLSLVSCAISLQWLVDLTTASDPKLSNRIGPPFLYYLLAVGFGLASFVVALAGRVQAETTDSDTPNHSTD